MKSGGKKAEEGDEQGKGGGRRVRALSGGKSELSGAFGVHGSPTLAKSAMNSFTQCL